MKNMIKALTEFMKLFSARSADAAEFSAAKKGLPSLVILSTPTCPACEQMSPVKDSINEKYSEKIIVEKIDLSNRRELASEFNVKYVPHLLFIDAEGKVFQQEIGFMQEEDVLSTFEKAGIKIK